MYSVNQFIHEQEAIFILYTCRHYLTAMLYGFKSVSGGNGAPAMTGLIGC